MPQLLKIDKLQGEKMYCLCSNKSFDDIVVYQSQARLPFQQLLDQITACTSTGCGSCIEPLQLELEERGLLFCELNKDAV